jgi:hypothetical protein
MRIFRLLPALPALCVFLLASQPASASPVGDEATQQSKDAVKGCQEAIRNKIKTEHADPQINFETVESNNVGTEWIAVKGRVRKTKGGDSATLNYTCRVEKATGMVKRAEYAKEK